MCNTVRCQRVVCMVPMGIHDMHAMHSARVGKNSACLYMYNCIFKCELVLILSEVPLTIRRAELHKDTKNTTKGAKITDTQMIQFRANV